MVTRMQMRRARIEADALLSDLEIDQEQPIDVFSIIDRLGLWLVFNRLQNLLGAVVPSGRGGIMISTQRGVAVQRFTAAHEIGHWVLDYGEAQFDTEEDVYHPAAEREVLAQTFASHLLMPPPLIVAASTRYGVADSASASPEAVYSIARDIGASYEAVVRQLVHLEVIDSRQRDVLLRTRPGVIKERLARGHRPVGAVDVWPTGFEATPKTLTIIEGDEVIVALPENRTTGYRWLTHAELEQRRARQVSEPPSVGGSDVAQPTPNRDWRPPTDFRKAPKDAVKRALDRLPGNRGLVRTLVAETSIPSSIPPFSIAPTLSVVDDRFLAHRASGASSELRSQRRAIANDEQISQNFAVRPSSLSVKVPSAAGGTGERVLALRSAGEGASTFTLSYSSAFDPAAPPVESYVLEVTVAPRPEVLRRRAYLNIALDGETESQDAGE